MSHALVDGWKMDLDRGPDWLFVRLLPPEHSSNGESDLASSLWDVMAKQFTYRLVLELDQLRILNSHLLGVLVRLSRRVTANGGVLRICGLSDSNRNVLRMTGLETCFAHFDDRGAAVMGHRPTQPR